MERLLASSSPPRPLASKLLCQPEVSRSLTATSLVCLHHVSALTLSHTLTNTSSSQVPSLSVRFVATRSPPSFSSASFPSSVLSVKSPKTSRATSASSLPPSVLFKSPLRLTSSPSSRTLTFAPSSMFQSLLQTSHGHLLTFSKCKACHNPVQGHPACPPSPW